MLCCGKIFPFDLDVIRKKWNIKYLRKYTHTHGTERVEGESITKIKWKMMSEMKINEHDLCVYTDNIDANLLAET